MGRFKYASRKIIERLSSSFVSTEEQNAEILFYSETKLFWLFPQWTINLKGKFIKSLHGVLDVRWTSTTGSISAELLLRLCQVKVSTFLKRNSYSDRLDSLPFFTLSKNTWMKLSRSGLDCSWKNPSAWTNSWMITFSFKHFFARDNCWLPRILPMKLKHLQKEI